MALWFFRKRGQVTIQRKDGPPPWPQRVYVWLEDRPERQLEVFGRLLERLAPGSVDRVVLGFRTNEVQERTLAQFATPVPIARLRDLLAALRAQNLQLYWGPEGVDADLAIICELYDHHIEICVPEGRRSSVAATLSEFESGAA